MNYVPGKYIIPLPPSFDRNFFIDYAVSALEKVGNKSWTLAQVTERANVLNPAREKEEFWTK